MLLAKVKIPLLDFLLQKHHRKVVQRLISHLSFSMFQPLSLSTDFFLRKVIFSNPEKYFCTKNTINCDNSMHKNKTFEYLEKKNLIIGDQIQRNFQNAEFGRLQLKTEWRQGFLEVTTASKLCWNFFWLNSLDQPPWQPQNWPLAFLRSKKHSIFAVFKAVMAI